MACGQHVLTRGEKIMAATWVIVLFAIEHTFSLVNLYCIFTEVEGWTLRFVQLCLTRARFHPTNFDIVTNLLKDTLIPQNPPQHVPALLSLVGFTH